MIRTEVQVRATVRHVRGLYDRLRAEMDQLERAILSRSEGFLVNYRGRRRARWRMQDDLARTREQMRRLLRQHEWLPLVALLALLACGPRVSQEDDETIRIERAIERHWEIHHDRTGKYEATCPTCHEPAAL